MITTVLAFLLTLGILVVIHEYGHYRVAVACGVKVLRFSVGFGRVLWRRQSGPDATEFVVCSLPLGGYVRMLDEREAPVAKGEVSRAFNRKTLWQRTAIVSAGPLANLGLAVLLYAAAHWIGIQEPKALLGPPVAGSLADRAGLRAGDWVRALSHEGDDWQDLRSLTDLRWELTQAALKRQPVQLQVSDHDGRGSRTLRLDLSGIAPDEVDGELARRIGLGGPWREPVLGEVKTGGPAAVAGLRAGDRVLSIDGQPIADAQTVVELVRGNLRDGKASPQRWVVERAGRRIDIEVTPRVMSERGQTFGRIDAAPGQPPLMETVRHGVFDGLWQGAVRTWDVAALTVKMLGRMLIGQASLKNLSGPLTIADYAGQSVNQGLAYYLGFLALVSVSLGVLNLLPLPMLDGGHLMYYIFEGVTGRPVSDLWLARLQRGGIVVLLMMMSVALFNDVARLLGLH
ncbi:MAG: RIP metalloprotease RseP [Leptothrix sp. (in: Bacteria)]|nr:RIP metalloprotease RseP [Leptothrix sp. (in: b-proteobacteria)]